MSVGDQIWRNELINKIESEIMYRLLEKKESIEEIRTRIKSLNLANEQRKHILSFIEDLEKWRRARNDRGRC
ncbi:MULTISPECIES: hypothetical protein [unclassified Butyrivibrio]|uniref:hypothetical protein n=1 Tax=unclassified Butyrivibrio TaxID=2639466 RepID=UPI0003B6C995|nr:MULTISPECIES: hypothetical protein [unclassified Butyrivibrio]